MVNEEEQNKISEEIEVKARLMAVVGEIGKNIKDDYVLASFSSAERDYITENYENAEFAKVLVSRFGDKGFNYKFDDEKGDWIRDENKEPKKIPLKEEDKDRIQDISNRIFTFFMIKSHMLSILGRNNSTNFLVKLLGKYAEEEQPIMYGGDDRSKIQKIYDRLAGNEPETFEEQ